VVFGKLEIHGDLLAGERFKQKSRGCENRDVGFGGIGRSMG